MKVYNVPLTPNFKAEFINKSLIKNIDNYANKTKSAKKYQAARININELKKTSNIDIEVLTNLDNHPTIIFKNLKNSELYIFNSNEQIHPFTHAVKSIIKFSKLMKNKKELNKFFE